MIVDDRAGQAAGQFFIIKNTAAPTSSGRFAFGDGLAEPASGR